MALKRQQLNASQTAQPTGSPLSPLPIPVLTPSSRRAGHTNNQAEPPSADVENDIHSLSSRPPIRRHKTVVFELVTERKNKQTPSTPPQKKKRVAAAVEFQLVLEKPKRVLAEEEENQQHKKQTHKQSERGASAAVPAEKNLSAKPHKLAKAAKAADKENTAVTAAAATPAANNSNKRTSLSHLPITSSSFSQQPAASRPRAAASKTKPTPTVPQASVRPPSMSALRHELLSLPLHLMQNELTRIGQHCRDALPTFPSLYPASPPLSALLRWLQTVCWAVSSDRHCQTLRVDNFTTALSDGLAMLALLDWYGLAQHPFDQLRWHKQAKLYKQTVSQQAPLSTIAPPATGTTTTADTTTGDLATQEATDQISKGWSCSFSFSDLTRTSPSDEHSAADHNWTLFLSSLHSLSPSLFLSCPFSVDFFYGGSGGGGGRGCDERVVVVFVCRMACELLGRSEQLHAVRRLQRWWRRCVEKRTMRQMVKQLLAEAAEAAEEDTAEGEVGEADVEVTNDSIEDASSERSKVFVDEVSSDESVAHLEVLAQTEDSRAWAETAEASNDFVFSPAANRMPRNAREQQMHAEWEDRTSALQQARRQAEMEQQLQDEQAGITLARQQAAEQRAAHQLQLARQHAKQKYQRTVDAVTVLQSAWRGKQARQQLAHLRELKRRTDELERQRREEAAVCVQRVWRGYRLRKDVRLILSIKAEVEVELAEEVERLKRQRAATSIQALVRGWLARRSAQRLRLQQLVEAQHRAEQAEHERRQRCRHAATLALQPFLHRHITRIHAEEQLALRQQQLELQDASARVIQRAWRRWHQKQAVVMELREEIQAARIESVVIGLQARVRGKLARRQVQRLRDERFAAKAAEVSDQLKQEEKRKEEHDRLLRRVQSLNAIVIQRQVRVFLAKRRLEALVASKRLQEQQLVVERQRSAMLIQSVWRGHQQRKATPGLASRRAELAVLECNVAASPHLRVVERCAAAMSALLNARSLSAAIRACQSMLHLSALLPSLCEDIVNHESTLPALLSLIRSAGRTMPHTELVLAALALLNQLAAHPPTNHSLYTTQPLLLPTLTEQLQLSRDNSRITRRILRLLRTGEQWQQWRLEVRESEGGGVRRRLDGVCELLERKCRTERRYVLGLFAVAGSESSQQMRSRQEREAVSANLRRFLQVIDTDVV